MTKLLYSTITSLDGKVEDGDGSIGWGAPDEEVGAFINELERPLGTYLFGRRLYEVMLYWETALETPGQTPAHRAFAALWQAANKVVYSRTLQVAPSAKTSIQRELDPAAIRQLKATATAGLSIGGAQLAGQALGAGLVDEVAFFVVPVVLGGGKPALPSRLHLDLELLDERRFKSGVTYLHYRVDAAHPS